MHLVLLMHAEKHAVANVSLSALMVASRQWRIALEQPLHLQSRTTYPSKTAQLQRVTESTPEYYSSSEVLDRSGRRDQRGKQDSWCTSDWSIPIVRAFVPAVETFP